MAAGDALAVQWLQPAMAIRCLAREQAKEQLLYLAGQRSGLAAAHRLAIDRADRGDLGGGAAHEQLIAQIQVFTRHFALDHRDASIACQPHDAIAGEAVEDGRTDGRGMQRTFEDRSEEHTSELQSLMRISYAVFCLKKKKQTR